MEFRRILKLATDRFVEITAAVVAGVVVAIIVARYNLDRKEVKTTAQPSATLAQQTKSDLPAASQANNSSTQVAGSMPPAVPVETHRSTQTSRLKATATPPAEERAPTDTAAMSCAYLEFETRPGDQTLHLGLFGQHAPAIEPGCTPAIAALNADNGFSPDRMDPLEDGGCIWRDLAEALGEHQLSCTTFSVRPGRYVIRLPSEYSKSLEVRAALDLHRENGEVSEGMGALPSSFFKYKSGLTVARLWYSRDEVPDDYAQTNFWWHWIRAQ